MMRTTVVSSIIQITFLLIMATKCRALCSGAQRPPCRRDGLQRLASAVRQNDATPSPPQTTVSVTVERILSHVTPAKAKEAWLEHHWRRGGGLPNLIQHPLMAQPDDDAPRRRTVLPVGLQETLLIESSSDNQETLRYTVSDPGPLLGQHLVPDSHRAVVTFVAIGQTSACRMMWKVDFKVHSKNWQRVYQAFTEWSMETAATTIEEATSVPRLFTLTAMLPPGCSPDDAAAAWLDFFWAKGGGLPLPPAIPYGDPIAGLSSSVVRTSLLRIPPFLKDTIQSVHWAARNKNNINTDTTSSSTTVDTTTTTAVVCYAIENPGWQTIPFLMHTHAGKVCFAPAAADGSTTSEMRWEIEIRPFPVAAMIVEKLIEMAASTITRNLLVRLAEPGAVVEIKPPRGGGWDHNDQAVVVLGRVPKDTWLGGVLDAHLTDHRTTVEQTLSLMKPWTWGRTGQGDETDSVHFHWSDMS